MSLPNDITRCSGVGCPVRDRCGRHVDLKSGPDDVQISISDRLCDSPAGLPFFLYTDAGDAPAFRCEGVGCLRRKDCARYVKNNTDVRQRIALIGVDGQCGYFIASEGLTG